MPQACTLMRTCPAPGVGISRSTISQSPPAFDTCTAFIFAPPAFAIAASPFGEFAPLVGCRAPSRQLQTFFGEDDRLPSQDIPHSQLTTTRRVAAGRVPRPRFLRAGLGLTLTLT